MQTRGRPALRFEPTWISRAALSSSSITQHHFVHSSYNLFTPQARYFIYVMIYIFIGQTKLVWMSVHGSERRAKCAVNN
eukprot:scaffold647931_cov43-Prasinocladus_malaysianus.AAC.2